MKKVALVFMSLLLPPLCNAMEEMPSNNPELLLITNKATEFERYSMIHWLINEQFEKIRRQFDLNCMTPSPELSQNIITEVISEKFYTYADALKDAFIEPDMEYCPRDIYKVITRGMNDYLDFMSDTLKDSNDFVSLKSALVKLRPLLFIKLYRASKLVKIV